MGIRNVGAIDSKARDIRPETCDSRRAHTRFIDLYRLSIEETGATFVRCSERVRL